MVDFSEIDTPTIVGKLGEVYAFLHLMEAGYRVCGARVAHTIGITQPLRSRLPEWGCVNLLPLAHLCKRLLKCDVPGTPCRYQSNRTFQFGSGPGPEASHSRANDDPIQSRCALRMSYLAILERCRSVCDRHLCPIRSYLQIDHYIRAVYNEHGHSGGSLPSRGPVQLRLPFSHQVTSLGDARREWNAFWSGHPGRIDLFALRQEQHSCFEVKTNKGRLSRWQAIRLNWMREHGVFAGIVRVSMEVPDRDELINLCSLEEVDGALSELSRSCSIEEFLPADYRRYRDSFPTVDDVKRYNSKRYWYTSIEWREGAKRE